jgi:small subunit ribosomal protein S24e
VSEAEKMEIEITEAKENLLLGRKEVTFTLRHDAEGASPSRAAARNALIKALKCSSSLLVIDQMRTEFGKRETVGYAKVYESEARLNEIEQKHIIERNVRSSGASEAKGEAKSDAKSEAKSKAKSEAKSAKG